MVGVSNPTAGSTRPLSFTREDRSADEPEVDEVELAVARAVARVDEVVSDTLGHVSAVDVVDGAIERSSRRLAQVARRPPMAPPALPEADGEVNAVMAQIVARLNGDPLPNDPYVRELFSDREVDQRFGEVTERLTLQPRGAYERDPSIDQLLNAVRSSAPVDDPPLASAFTEPPVVEPAVVQPTVVEPTVVQPTVVEATVVEPAAVQPTAAKIDPAPARVRELATQPAPIDPFSEAEPGGQTVPDVPGSWGWSLNRRAAADLLPMVDESSTKVRSEPEAELVVDAAEHAIDIASGLTQSASADRLTLSPPPLPLESEVKERMVTRVVLALLVVGLLAMGTLLAVFLLWVGYTPIWQGR